MNEESQLQEILGPGGVIARTHPNYEHRPGQIRMAEAVAAAIRDRTHLCVEAGTGTGKTLAYLIPAILSGRRVVVSTGTKNLQEQLFFKDIPFLEKALGTELSVCCMKGRSNYVCVRKLAETENEGYLFSPEDPRYLKRIRTWAKTTETGDRAELRNVPEALPLWKRIDARRETCTGQKCPDFDACWITRMRRRAQESDIIVVNHHLFFADLSLKQGDFGAVLPDYSVVIFDEAHELEDVATQYFGVGVSNYRLDELVRDGEKALKDQADPSFLSAQLARTAVLATSFFHSFRAREGRHSMAEYGPGRAVMRGPGEPSGNLDDAYVELSAQLSVLQAGFANLAVSSESIQSVARRAGEVKSDLGIIMESGSDEDVYWFETRGKGTFIWASPILVAPVLSERLFSHVDTVVLTSATLSTGGDFRFIRSRLGLEQSGEMILGSHFDFSRQTILYVPRSIPEPREEGWLRQACLELEHLLESSRGRAFVLFTSYSQMNQVAGALQGRLPYPFFVQGEMSKSGLIEAFRETPNAVLFATSSFWQGVDVQGEQLSCVVIDKLPFSVPSDPVVAARIRHLTQTGASPFYDYQIPEAVILLKQGMGRLIRSREDRGILALLDKRILTKSYGRVFLESLPPAPLTHDRDQVRRFMA
jgi:ATP-dependent DNA helicase DinG